MLDYFYGERVAGHYQSISDRVSPLFLSPRATTPHNHTLHIRPDLWGADALGDTEGVPYPDNPNRQSQSSNYRIVNRIPAEDDYTPAAKSFERTQLLHPLCR